MERAEPTTRARDVYRASFGRRVLRRSGRLSRGVAWTLALSALWLLGRPFQRGPARARAWRARTLAAWGRAMARCAAFAIRVEGEPPREPCILVTNHCGYADVVALAAILEAPAFVSMHAIRGWPLVGFMAARMGTIFIDRSDKRALPDVNRRIEAALARGDVIVLFAEGANSDGTVVRPFRPALLEPAARLGAACAWATIHYAVLPGDPPSSRSVAWCDEPIRRQVARFLALERVDVVVRFGAGRLRGDDRKLLAADLHARASAQFVPFG